MTQKSWNFQWAVFIHLKRLKSSGLVLLTKFTFYHSEVSLKYFMRSYKCLPFFQFAQNIKSKMYFSPLLCYYFIFLKSTSVVLCHNSFIYSPQLSVTNNILFLTSSNKKRFIAEDEFYLCLALSLYMKAWKK